MYYPCQSVNLYLIYSLIRLKMDDFINFRIVLAPYQTISIEKYYPHKNVLLALLK